MELPYVYCYTISKIPFPVDVCDLEFVSSHRWSISRGYIRRTSDGRYLHNLLMNPEKGLVTDHINRDKLDNRRNNLRVCSRRQNLLNTSLRSDNTTGYKGVSKTTKTDTYEVNIWNKGKRTRRTGFKSPEEAFTIYSKLANKLHGEFAVN